MPNTTMYSIRTRILNLVTLAVIISILSVGLICFVSLRRIVMNDTNEKMRMLCEGRRKSLDSYLEDVEQAVETICDFAIRNLENGDVDLTEHVKTVREFADPLAANANGVMTYYYRLDPKFSDESGFWCYRLSRGGDFLEAEPTDISLYDEDDVSHVGWFTIPKKTGHALWMDPYYNDNIKAEMVSYVEPVFYDGKFIGVIGIDIPYEVLSSQIEDIRIYRSGYAYVLSENNTIIYHPDYSIGDSMDHIDYVVVENKDETSGKVRYQHNGENKIATYETLSNGMRLYITANEKEIDYEWIKVVSRFAIISAAVLLFFVVITTLLADNIIKPLDKITEAASQIGEGNYDFDLDYKGNDEVGVLTGVFRDLSDHLKVYISDLNSMAYSDALTSVRNKAAYDINERKLNDIISSNQDIKVEFAIAMFDCNDLKTINDNYGHDKGDIYPKNACQLICDTFRHSPVFRVGGDEFVVILQDQDFYMRDELLEQFDKAADRSKNDASEEWNIINVAHGIAIYDPALDSNAGDVLKRADALMYEDKKAYKAA